MIRPAQDSSQGYGSALALCKIDRLDSVEYSESVIKRVVPSDNVFSSGIHTINISTDFVVVDGKRRSFSLLAFFFKLRNKIFGLSNG